jgi:hypothetical protein
MYILSSCCFFFFLPLLFLIFIISSVPPLWLLVFNDLLISFIYITLFISLFLNLPSLHSHLFLCTSSPICFHFLYSLNTVHTFSFSVPFFFLFVAPNSLPCFSYAFKFLSIFTAFVLPSVATTHSVLKQVSVVNIVLKYDLNRNYILLYTLLLWPHSLHSRPG